MKKNGYTLVEIVIVLAIIILMALVSMPAFNKYNLSNNFDTKAEEIVSLFNKAYSLSKSPPRVTDGATQEFVCDTIDVGRLGSQFRVFLKRSLPNGTKVDCKSGNVEDSTYQIVEVNDNPSLDVLDISVPATSNRWRFSADSVKLGAEGSLIAISSTKLSKKLNISLDASQNTFTIKRD